MSTTLDSVIAVLSGAHSSTLSETLAVMQKVFTATGGPVPEEWQPFAPCPESFTIIADQGHRAVQSQFAAARWIFVNSEVEAPSLVGQILEQYAGSERRVLLLGFKGQIFRIGKAPWRGIQVRPKHFHQESDQPLLTSVTFAKVQLAGPEPLWTFLHLSTLDEALVTLEEVLRSRGAYLPQQAVRQTKLRPLMGASNPTRFSGNAATTRSSGMIATLLHAAAVRGIVSLSGDPGDYLVWLNPVENRPSEHAGKAEETVRTALSLAPPPSAPSIAVQSEVQKQRRPRQPEKYRSDLFSEQICQANMGPFPVARPKVYDALAALENSNIKLSLSAFVSAAVARAKDSCPGGEPWEAIRHVTQAQLLKAQVVRNETGDPLPVHWTSGSRIVCSLAPNWRLRTVGEILLAVFEAGNVTGQDVANICRSVWGSSEGPALDEFHAVMDYLMNDAHVVEEDTAGVFRVKRPKPNDRPIPGTTVRTERGIPASESADNTGNPEDLVH
jgi:hypothetical protein